MIIKNRVTKNKSAPSSSMALDYNKYIKRVIGVKTLEVINMPYN